MASQRQTGLTSRSPFPNAYALSAQGRDKDTNNSLMFNVYRLTFLSLNDNNLNNTLCIAFHAFHARALLFFLSKNLLNLLQGRIIQLIDNEL